MSFRLNACTSRTNQLIFMEQLPIKLLPHWLKPKKSNNLYLCSNHRNSLNLYRRKIYSKQNCTTNNTVCINVTFKVLRDRRREQVHIWLCILNNLTMVLNIVLSRHRVRTRDTRPTRIVFKGTKLTITAFIITWRYSPTWALASCAIRLHSSLSWAFLLHPSIPISRRSSWTSSSHLTFGLPIFLLV
jgi:hypothetical protein